MDLVSQGSVIWKDVSKPNLTIRTSEAWTFVDPVFWKRTTIMFLGSAGTLGKLSTCLLLVMTEVSDLCCSSCLAMAWTLLTVIGCGP